MARGQKLGGSNGYTVASDKITPYDKVRAVSAVIINEN